MWYYILKTPNSQYIGFNQLEKELLDIINVFSKVAGSKINTQKSVPSLCTSSENSKKWGNYPFTITGNTIRYLRINLTKEVKDLDNEKCKTLLKEIEEEINNWKDINFSDQWFWNTIKMFMLLHKAISGFKAIPIKIPIAFSTAIE